MSTDNIFPRADIDKDFLSTTPEGTDAAPIKLAKATRNACKMCSPLGAALVFRGLQNCVPFLHGSQGCATYIRRYLISHYKEPMDIASSSFSEKDAVYGGAGNFSLGIANVIRQYRPEIVGIATTCLAETIGEDMNLLIAEFDRKYAEENGPALVHCSTPSYQGSHADGYWRALMAVVSQLSIPEQPAEETTENKAQDLAQTPDEESNFLGNLCKNC